MEVQKRAVTDLQVIKDRGVLTFVKNSQQAEKVPEMVKELFPRRIQKMLTETQFWSEESQFFIKLSRQLDYCRLSHGDQQLIEDLNEGLRYFMKNLVDQHQKVLEGVQQSKSYPKKQLVLLRIDHNHLRGIYENIKQLYLPILSKMIPISFF